MDELCPGQAMMSLLVEEWLAADCDYLPKANTQER